MSTQLQISFAALITVCVICVVYLVTAKSPTSSDVQALDFPLQVTATLAPGTATVPERQGGRTAPNRVDVVTAAISTAESSGENRIHSRASSFNRRHSAANNRSSQTLLPNNDNVALPRVQARADAAHSHAREINDGPAGPDVAQPQVPWSFANGPSGREVVVPIGAALPAALLDAAEGATPAQLEALDRIAADFIEDLAAPEESTSVPAPSNGRKPKPTPWEAATHQPNERYRQLFGIEAYNALTAAAAREGLVEAAAQALVLP